MLTHLLLSGGGLSGLSYMGVYRYLQENDLLETITHVGGVSIGAMFATMFCMDISPSVLEAYVKDFVTSKDNMSIAISNPMDIWVKHGFANTEMFLTPIRHFLKTKYHHSASTITFQAFAKMTGKTLSISATNLTTSKTMVFSVDTTPSACVLQAVGASACVPFLFKPVRIGDDVYVDGGVSCELPNLPFDEAHAKSSLAIFLAQSSKPPRTNNGFLDYLGSIIYSTFSNFRTLRFYKNKIVLHHNPIEFLPVAFTRLTSGASKIEINITASQVQDSIKYGFDEASKYFTAREPKELQLELQEQQQA